MSYKIQLVQDLKPNDLLVGALQKLEEDSVFSTKIV